MKVIFYSADGVEVETMEGAESIIVRTATHTGLAFRKVAKGQPDGPLQQVVNGQLVETL